jgi:hypothetical protein
MISFYMYIFASNIHNITNTMRSFDEGHVAYIHDKCSYMQRVRVDDNAIAVVSS